MTDLDAILFDVDDFYLSFVPKYGPKALFHYQKITKQLSRRISNVSNLALKDNHTSGYLKCD